MVGLYFAERFFNCQTNLTWVYSQFQRCTHVTLSYYLQERDMSDACLEMIGPLLNLEGRFHFSLVEWFSHYYEDVFGDLVYIKDGRVPCPMPLPLI